MHKKLIRYVKRKMYLTKKYFVGLYFDLFIREYKTEGLRFKIPFELTSRIFRSRFVLDLWESPDEIKFMRKYVGKKATVLELGGCIGVLSCITNKHLENPDGHVVVEANPKLIEYLEFNRDQNNCCFSIEECMVSSQKNNTFYLHEMIVGGSDKRKTDDKVTVTGKGFRDIEKRYQLKFDTLIIDIEGGELKLLQENKNYLKQIYLILIEIHPFANILTLEESGHCEQILQDASFEKIDKTEKNVYQVWEKLANI